MKNHISKSLFFICTLVLIASCSSSDDGGTQQIIPFTVLIDGQSYLPTSVPLGQMSNSGRFIIINAINTVTDETITLSIGDSSGTSPELEAGTYPVMGGGTKISYFVNNGTYTTDTNGQIVITSLDTQSRKISGTFQCVATGTFGTNGSFTLSNGEFTDISYSVQ